MTRPDVTLMHFGWPVLAAALLLSGSVSGQQPGGATVGVTKANEVKPTPPPPTVPKPPVDLFRSLLAMTPIERREFLAKRPPESQKLILAKIREYEGLTTEMQDLRLRVTELRWYLLPLLSMPVADRAQKVAAIPSDELRELIEVRLRQWDKLDPSVQKEFLENEPTLRVYFEFAARRPPQPGEKGTNVSSVAQQTINAGVEKWQALTDEQRQEIERHVHEYFELTPAEKEKTLNTLSSPERAQIEKTLQTFGALSPAQRIECVRSFDKFARFTPQERQQFLHNAQVWEKMSPSDRQAWRNLVSNLSHQPPYPPGLNQPPIPRRQAPTAVDPTRSTGSLLTNGN